MGPVMNYANEKVLDPFTLICYPGKDWDLKLYEDDGMSFEYLQGQSCFTSYHIKSDQKNVTLSIAAREGNYQIPERKCTIVLRDETIPTKNNYRYRSGERNPF